MLLTLPGCSSRSFSNHSDETRITVLEFADHTGSTVYLQSDIIRFATQVAVAAPPHTVIEACTFGSDVQVAPFYTGKIRKPILFKNALKAELAKPSNGRGTFGAPLLRRVRERLQQQGKPILVIFVSDCGFDDLAEINAEAKLLAKEPNFIALYGLPAVSDSSAYTKLEAALKPLGNRVRLAASADAPEAIREIQAILRKGGK
ncbi:hypothetical protein [Armatimonas sp.]|uniref:hypothetical protein n=1 Tax=Armatimonas sp. TaxID=1872638 RepID=UPI0037510140